MSKQKEDHKQGAPTRWSRRRLSALVCTLLLLVPGAMALITAIIDGERRKTAAPFEALFGARTYQALREGKNTTGHYWGRERRAPDFELRDQYDRAWRLGKQRGKVVVLNFWTKTCKPCLDEMPSLERLAQLVQHRQDIELATITIDKDWPDVSPVFQGNTPLRVLFDPKRSVVRDRFGTKLYPETWIIDAQGVVRLRYDGPNDWSSPLSLEIIESFL